MRIGKFLPELGLAGIRKIFVRRHGPQRAFSARINLWFAIREFNQGTILVPRRAGDPRRDRFRLTKRYFDLPLSVLCVTCRREYRGRNRKRHREIAPA